MHTNHSCIDNMFINYALKKRYTKNVNFLSS